MLAEPRVGLKVFLVSESTFTTTGGTSVVHFSSLLDFSWCLLGHLLR
jgi:hypothetical protein